MANPRATRSSRQGRPRGVSILEVLFAILVTTIGLLGAVALFPVASAQARKARINDAMAVAGRSAVHTFDALGMRRPDRWVYWDPVAGRFQGVPFVAGVPSIPTGTCICIDPRLIAANYDPAAFARTRLAANFPYGTPATLPAPYGREPRMTRVSLVSAPRIYAVPMGITVLGGTPWRTYQENVLFQLDDDLAFLRPGIDETSATSIPSDRSLPAFQAYDTLPATGDLAKRQAQGHMSWMATLVPKLMLGQPVSDEYILSIVVFYDRPADLTAGDPLHERVLEAYVEDGFQGGEVLLHWTAAQNSTNDALAAQVLKLRANDWILLGANYYGSSVPRFQWYRVSACDDEPTYNTTTLPAFTGAGYQLNATLIGQDWDTRLVNPLITAATASPPTVFGTAQATIVDGVVGVYEKTMRLDTSSGY